MDLLSSLCHPGILFKEPHDAGDDALLFGGPVSASETGHRRHDPVKFHPGCFQFSVPEGVVNEPFCLFWFEPLLCDDLIQVRFLLVLDELPPVPVHLRSRGDGGNEVVDQFLFASQLDAGVNGLVNLHQDLLVLAVRPMILSHQH